MMFLFETSEGIFAFVFLVTTIIALPSWIVFARLTMARIEREIRADGLPRPAQWDGVGYRALWYLHAIIFPVGIWNRPDDPLIDVALVRRYANRTDIIRGWVFFISNTLWVFMILIFMIFFNK